MTRIRFFLGLLGLRAVAQSPTTSVCASLNGQGKCTVEVGTLTSRRTYEETWGETPEQYEKRMARKPKPANGECPACATVAPAVTAKALLAAVPFGTCYAGAGYSGDPNVALSVCRAPQESDMATVQRVVCGHCRCVFEMDVTR